MTAETLLDAVAEVDIEIREKERVFSDLRDKGYIPQDRLQFGTTSVSTPGRRATPRCWSTPFRQELPCR